MAFEAIDIEGKDEDFSIIKEKTKMWPVIRIDDQEDWSLLAKDDIFVYATPAADGTVTFSKDKLDITVKDVKHSNPLDQEFVNAITLKLHNNGAEYRGWFKLVPTYENDSAPTESDATKEGAFLPAGQDADVTFLFSPTKTGKATLRILMSDGTELHRFEVTVEEVPDDDPTGISNPQMESQTGIVKYYNLNGQQLSSPKKGIHIVNGKKFVK